MDRKDFIKKMAGSLILAVPIVSVLSCSDSDGDSLPPTGSNPEKDCLKNGTKSAINSNHGHTLIVSKVDVDSGMAKEYSITGSADHGHTITISEDNFDRLKNNQQIQMNSTSGSGHSHSIVVSCA